MKKLMLIAGAMMFWSSLALAEDALLKNGDLQIEAGQNVPTSWAKAKRTDGEVWTAESKDLPAGCTSAAVTKIGPPTAHQGYLTQEGIKGFPANTAMVLEGKAKCEMEDIVSIQVKLYKAGKELKRVSSKTAGTSWTDLSVEFNTADADKMEILCRFIRREDTTGKSVSFANLKLRPAAAITNNTALQPATK